MSSQQKSVVLVHGMTDTSAVFKPMTRFLEQRGWRVHSLDLMPSNGDLELDHLATQLEQFITANLLGEQSFDLVGFSMGGLVSRYYVQRLGGLERVQRLVTIASPHNGTLAAHLSKRPGCVQMRPNSTFLLDLNRDIHQLEKLRFTSIWTPMDLMIVPAHSSIVPVGRNLKVSVPLHAWMVSDTRAINVVTTVLEEPLP